MGQLRRGLHLDVLDNFHLLQLLDEEKPDALQILAAQSRAVALTYLDAVHLVDLLVAAVGEELRHRWRTDYFRDAVGEVLRHRLRKDYFRDAARAELLELAQLELLELPQRHW